jgi:hypothetical protein
MFIQGILLFSFITNLYKYFYPEEYNIILYNLTTNYNLVKNYLEPKIIEVCYNGIYYYSVCQVYTQKFKILITPHIQVICTILNKYLQQQNIINSTQQPHFILEIYENGKSQENITLIKDNETFDKSKTASYIYNSTTNVKYDLIIVSDVTNIANNKVNKIHYVDFPTDFIYKLSNIKFISMDIIYNSVVYPIELKTADYNHYIINNVINTKFYQYYLINILKANISVKDFDYVVNLIDHNANFITIYPSQYVLIRENDYEIKTDSDSNDNIKEETKIENDKYKIIDKNEDSSSITEDANLYDFINLESPINN